MTRCVSPEAIGLRDRAWIANETLADARPQPPFRDGKRVLECLQKALRIATSSIDELTSVQLYCDALDQYLYYFERGVDAVSQPRSVSALCRSPARRCYTRLSGEIDGQVNES